MTLAAAQPALAQLAPTDPLDLGREFGAFVAPERAAAMVRECEANTKAVQAGAAEFLAAMEQWKTARGRYDGQLAEFRTARASVEEAEQRASILSGPEAERFRQEVLAPRQQRFAQLSQDLGMHTDSYDFALNHALRVAERTMASLRAAGVPEADMSAPAAELVHRQEERCRRMRAWAQLGAGVQGRAQAPQPAPSQSAAPGWPTAAIDAWSGQWSCRMQTVLGREVMTMDMNVRISATYDSGIVRVRVMSGWSQLPSRLFSQLYVGSDQPDLAYFQENGVGDDEKPTVISDTGRLVGPGRMTLQRRYSAAPAKFDSMDCTRTGPL